jgi:hypothetical protein
LEVIQRTSAVILSALETPAAETTEQQQGTVQAVAPMLLKKTA